MKVRGLRWWIIDLITVATIINYIDRSALSIMWSGISKELGMPENAEWFPVKERVAGQDIFNAVASFGFVVSPQFCIPGRKKWVIYSRASFIAFFYNWQ